MRNRSRALRQWMGISGKALWAMKKEKRDMMKMEAQDSSRLGEIPCNSEKGGCSLGIFCPLALCFWCS